MMKELAWFFFALFLWAANVNPEGAVSAVSGLVWLLGALLASPLAGAFVALLVAVPAFWLGAMSKAESIIAEEKSNLEKKAERWRSL